MAQVSSVNDQWEEPGDESSPEENEKGGDASVRLSKVKLRGLFFFDLPQFHNIIDGKTGYVAQPNPGSDFLKGSDLF